MAGWNVSTRSRAFPMNKSAPAASGTSEIDDDGSDKRIGEFGFKSCGRRGLHDGEIRFAGELGDVCGDLGIVVKYGDSSPAQHVSSPR
jgi:hypothetical protein